MAVRVVERFEVVQIKKQKHPVAATASTDGERLPQSVVEQVHSMAHSISEDSRAYLGRNREQLSCLAARPGVRAMDSSHCDPMLTELHRMSSLYSIVLLVDAQGRMVCQSLPAAGPA